MYDFIFSPKVYKVLIKVEFQVHDSLCFSSQKPLLRWQRPLSGRIQSGDLNSEYPGSRGVPRSSPSAGEPGAGWGDYSGCLHCILETQRKKRGEKGQIFVLCDRACGWSRFQMRRAIAINFCPLCRMSKSQAQRILEF